jgi:hypothetical protein
VKTSIKGGNVKFQHLFILLFFAGYCLAENSTVYNISGTVTKKGGGPLEGVTVLLKGENVSVVTGADGTFEFIPPISVRLQAPQTQALSFTLRGNTLAFSQGTGKLNGNVSILSGNGRCIASTDFSALNPATENIMLPQLASGINIVRITVNNSVYTCRIMRLGNELHLFNKYAGTPSAGGFTLAKRVASSDDAVDTILATKEGFKDAVLPIESYTMSDVSIEMNENSSLDGYPEFPGAGCDVSPGEYDAVDNPKLPNPFKMHDGTIISSMDEWECRRAEIIKDIEKFEVGPVPPPSDVEVSASFSGGTLKVTVTSKDGSLTMNNKVSGSGKCVVIGFGGGGSMVSGCTKIAFDHRAIAKDGMTGDAFETDGYYQVFPHLWQHEGDGNAIVGNYGAWAWGVSRMIDGMEQVKDEMGIDMSKISIHGCSWAGKGALWSGALDARIALTVAQESGGGGAASWRISEDYEDKTGKEVEDLDNTGWSWFIDWLLDPYIASGGGGKNPHLLPHDHHELVALIAPRALILLPGDPGNTHLAAHSAYCSFMAAREVWKAMGIEDRAGLVVHTNGGSHCSASSAQKSAVNKFVNRFLKDGNDNTNIVEPGGANYDWEQYVDWDTPTIPYP